MSADNHEEAIAGPRERHTLMTVMTGGAVKSPAKRRDDFWPTPDGVFRSLAQHPEFLRHLRGFKPAIWEPCCGDGSLAKAMMAEGFGVSSTSDINPRSGGAISDFFLDPPPNAQWNSIITNPPWSRSEDACRRALFLSGWAPGRRWMDGPRLVCMLVQQSFIFSGLAARLEDDGLSPDIIAPLTYRPDWTGQGRPTSSACWLVWVPRMFRDESPTVAFLRR